MEAKDTIVIRCFDLPGAERLGQIRGPGVTPRLTHGLKHSNAKQASFKAWNLTVRLADTLPGAVGNQTTNWAPTVATFKNCYNGVD